MSETLKEQIDAWRAKNRINLDFGSEVLWDQRFAEGDLDEARGIIRGFGKTNGFFRSVYLERRSYVGKVQEVLDFGHDLYYTAREINRVGQEEIDSRFFDENVQGYHRGEFTKTGVLLGTIAGTIAGAIFLPEDNYLLTSLAAGAAVGVVAGVSSNFFWRWDTKKDIEKQVISAAEVTDSYVHRLAKSFGEISF